MSLHGEVASIFDVAADLDTHAIADAGHGRIENRRASVCHVVNWLEAGRATPGEPYLAGRATIGMCQAEVEQNRETICSRRFCISSARLAEVQSDPP